MTGAAGCGNVDDDDGEVADAGGGDGDSDGDSDGDADGGSGSGLDECVELTLDLHEGTGQALVTLSTMTVTNEEADEYDFAMVNQMPEPPAIYLGPGATAVDMGNETGFTDVTEAPTDGYAADGDEPVIGTGWRSGGSGTTGHEMSGNVYAIETSDGRFAKIAVTSAKLGIVTIDAYLQPDGSGSLECSFAP
jgi:hypothetical protein